MKRWMLAALVMLLTPATLSAKGRTTKIVLICQGLPGPVTMTDGDALDFRFGPWGGGFLDSTAASSSNRPAGGQICEVDFYVTHGHNMEELAYVLYYTALDGGAGAIYLPGRGEPWYALNTGAMLRTGRDGAWWPATREWSAIVRRALSRAEHAEAAIQERP